MISVILYGRNDQHGYQYHKRVAISLNNLAEILTSPEDEILFVDYNTKDDLPTLPESIQDTLTSKAKSLLKILRVRHQHHARFEKITPLKMQEALARNIAIRRSHPLNRWILSTNTDMIFLPADNNPSLTSLFEYLPDGFYILPRFEIPEYLWDSQFIRHCPKHNLAVLREHGKSLHLHKVIHQQPFIGYDNPGDFQLMCRKDIFSIGGFNEEMVLGWHLDSNLNKRMYLTYNQKIESLAGKLIGYHCNHTRQETFLHSKSRLENSWNRFVEQVDSPMANTHHSWGMPDEVIEEIYLDDKRNPGQRYFNALMEVQAKSAPRDYESIIHPRYFNQLFYSSAQVFSYLADHLASVSKQTNIIYFGHNQVLLKKLDEFTQKMGFEKNIKNNVIYIFDFGFDESDSGCGMAALQEKRMQLKNLMKIFFNTVSKEKKNSHQNTFIGINTLYTDFRAIFRSKIACTVTSHNTNISYGCVKKSTRHSVSFSRQINHFYSRQKQCLFQTVHYLIARYFYDSSDKIRKLLIRSPIAKYFLKSPLKENKNG